MQPWDTHEPVGDWIPLASAPALEYLGGYQIGYRLQASGEPNQLQRVALTVAGVPDGQPSQPHNAEPYCVTRIGTPRRRSWRRGPSCSSRATAPTRSRCRSAPSAGGASGCLAGPSTTAGFTVVARAAPALSGSPLSFRARRPRRAVRRRARAPTRPAGRPTSAARSTRRVQPDGSVDRARSSSRRATATTPPEPVRRTPFPRPGVWTCVARATAEGVDEEFCRTVFGGSWSAPLTFDVRSDFRRKSGRLARPRARRPRFTFTAECPAEARRRPRHDHALPRDGLQRPRLPPAPRGRFRGRFGARRAQRHARAPRKPGYYIGRFAFGGTRFLRASVDPAPMFLSATRRTSGSRARSRAARATRRPRRLLRPC